MDTSILRRMYDLLHKVGKISTTGERADKHYIPENYETRITIIDRSERGSMPATNTYVFRHHYPIPQKLLYNLEAMALKHDETMEEKGVDHLSLRIRLLKLKNKKIKMLTKSKNNATIKVAGRSK